MVNLLICQVNCVFVFLYCYLQLAIRNEHTCLSRGYNFKFIGHANVNDILILYNTEPYGNIRMYTFGMMIL